MYLLTGLLLLGAALWLIQPGQSSVNMTRRLCGAILLLATLLAFGLMSLWGEWLWFQALDLEARFWLFLEAQGASLIVGALLAMLLCGLVTSPLDNRPLRYAALLAAGVAGAVWGAGSWSDLLVFLHRLPTEMRDPVFGLDTGFFLFTLPFLDELYYLLLYIVLVSGAAAGIGLFARGQGPRGNEAAIVSPEKGMQCLLYVAGLLALLLAGGQLLNAFHLVYSELGVVHGAGWTDVHIRLPAYLGMAALLLLLGPLTLLPAARRAAAKAFFRSSPTPDRQLNGTIAMWAGAAGLWLISLGLLPALTQWLIVEPNEITYERPYIERNIDFTLHGFDLDKVEERSYPASNSFTRATVDSNQHLLSEVRLWDWRALDAVYQQFQEIRLYYEFSDVDIDRYRVGGRYRQVMVSARELDQTNLAAQSQTFVNRRFKYTHGYGITLATVSDFTAEGLPNLLVKDIPPQSQYPELHIERPQIYYGELTAGPAVVNSDEAEFDYPSGESNRYIHYPGSGGVRLHNLWRKLVFGWKFDGTRLLFSGYPNSGSRILFHRQVQERVRRIAPFLTFDEDPYIVLAEGRLYWIIDAYTSSEYLPYSEPFSSREFIPGSDNDGASHSGLISTNLRGVNYVRNSVKAVVDAFDGDVDLYVFEPRDPVIRVWQRVLPRLFKPMQAMPSELRAHVRYPQDFLLAQGLVYAKYHMRDPNVFYNQEDLWVRATEKHYDQVQPVEPYYVMWELPGSDQAEFVLIQPFTPKNRQVLIGWIAGLSDGDNYGRFLAYKFPKEKRILGPQQVETKIDQDSFLSGQLTLWDQRGSNVIRGNVLAIPLDDTLIYVEPIYLKAQTAAYPELRLVVVMHGDKISYAERFDEALRGLFEESPQRQSIGTPAGLSRSELANRLNQAFNAYLDALSERKFDAAAAQLQRLSDLIDQAAQQPNE